MKKINLELHLPIKVEEPRNYLLVIRDAKDVCHYFLKDGTYDGYCKSCNGK